MQFFLFSKVNIDETVSAVSQLVCVCVCLTVARHITDNSEAIDVKIDTMTSVAGMHHVLII